MTKLEDDEVFKLQTKRWTELVELRQALTGQKMDPSGVDVAVANVFDPKKGQTTDSIIVDGKELMAMKLQLEELQIDSSNVKMTLAKAFLPGSRAIYAADLLKLKEMIKMREEMCRMGIPTGCIEATIEDVFKPLSAPAEEASETTLFTQPSWHTGAGDVVESPSRPAETEPVSKETGTDKPAEMQSQPIATKLPSPDVEQMTGVETSIEAMGLVPSPNVMSLPLAKAPSALTGTSTVRSTPSTKTTSKPSSPSTSLSNLSGKRSAPTDTALGSAESPICLESSPTPKRQRTAENIQPKNALRRSESWRIPIRFVGTTGLHFRPRHIETDMSVAFDNKSRHIVFHHGQNSLTALYPNLAIDSTGLLSITRSSYIQSKNPKMRFKWVDADAEENFLDIMVATKKDCRELIAKMKVVTSFSEIVLANFHMDRLFEDATWVVKETRNAVGVSEAKSSERVWLD